MTAPFRSSVARAQIHARYAELLQHWPVPNVHLRVPTSQGETFVIASGPEGADPLILLHGSMSVSASWMSDAALWSRHFRVYAVDMIGEAGFSAPSRPPLGDEAYAVWLDDVLDGLGVKRAAFVGVSLGGWLALDYASRRPARVHRLALLCPAGIGRQKHFALRAALLMFLGPWGVRKLRELVFGPPPKDLPPSARQLAALMGLISRGFRPRVQEVPRLDDPALRALAAPMLVIVGGRDVTIDSRDTQRRLRAHVPHADVRFLPGARHYIPGQAAAILVFLLSNSE